MQRAETETGDPFAPSETSEFDELGRLAARIPAMKRTARWLFNFSAVISGCLLLATAFLMYRSFFKEEVVAVLRSRWTSDARFQFSSAVVATRNGIFVFSMTRKGIDFSKQPTIPTALGDEGRDSFRRRNPGERGFIWRPATSGPSAVWPASRFGFGWELRSDPDDWKATVTIPGSILLLVTTELPAWYVWRKLTIRFARVKGRCPACGYDLRATPDRCPECGTDVLRGS